MWKRFLQIQRSQEVLLESQVILKIDIRKKGKRYQRPHLINISMVERMVEFYKIMDFNWSIVMYDVNTVVIS